MLQTLCYVSCTDIPEPGFGRSISGKYGWEGVGVMLFLPGPRAEALTGPVLTGLSTPLRRRGADFPEGVNPRGLTKPWASGPEGVREE